MRFLIRYIFWIFLLAIPLIFYFMKDIGPEPEPTPDPLVDVNGYKHGTYKNYNSSGKLYTAVTYVHGQKEGSSYIYHPNGQVMLEQNFIKSKREGWSYKYYDDGSIYAKTPYSNDVIDGMRTTYYKDGLLRSTIPYSKNQPGLGLEEYFKDGRLKEQPQLEVKKGNVNGQLALILNVEDCEKSRYYQGLLVDNKFLDDSPDVVKPLPEIEGQGYVLLDSEQDQPNLLCQCKTSMGNPLVLKYSWP